MGMMIQPSRFAVAGGGGEGYRYWRVLVDRIQADNNTYAAIGLLEMYDSSLTGAGRQDQCIGGTPIASGGGFAGGDNPPDAFDSRTDTLWANNAEYRWLGYDFGPGVFRTIDRVSIRSRNNALSQSPLDFSVQYSADGLEWTTAWAKLGLAGWYGKEERLFAAPSYAAPSYTGSPHGAHRYWRALPIYARSGDTTYAVTEVEMRATPGGADLTGGGVATAHSNFQGTPGDYDAPKAFDNNNGTLWSADGPSEYGWLEYDFGTAVAVADVWIRARDGGSQSQCPRVGSIQFSDDNVNWSTAYSFDFNPSGQGSGTADSAIDPAYI